jgi:hypothetical protein
MWRWIEETCHPGEPAMKPETTVAIRWLFATAVGLAWMAGHRASAAEEAAGRLCEVWQTEYAGEDAAGEHVVALWSFNEKQELVDLSGHGHDLVLEEAAISAAGRAGLGSCLESFAGWPVNDARHRARAKDQPDLSPSGPFTLELWISPKAELNADYPDAFLIDKKYVADDDYQLILGGADRSGNRTLRACLGFGSDSSTWYSRPLQFDSGNWYHVAFTYDGAGTGSFFVDGIPAGTSRVEGRKGISPGSHFLSIGDRIGSYYHGFPGFIDQVRISNRVLEFRRAKFDSIGQRHVFVRMEQGATERFRLTNLQRAPLAGAAVTISCEAMADKPMKVEGLAPGESVEIDYPLDTSLRADSYSIDARLVVDGNPPVESRETFPVRIVPRSSPDRFPVLMWGVYGNVPQEIERLKRIGFTHVLGVGADYSKVYEAGGPTLAAEPDKVAETRASLDAALAADLSLVASLSPGAAMRSREEFRRVDREGKPQAGRDDVCGLFGELQKFCYNVGASVVQTYGDHPALAAALIHTEVRDHAQPCFHPHDLEAFKAATGLEIPAEVAGRTGVDYTKLPDFPASRVIADDHPLYVYYRWYWKTGDGWPGLNTALHQGLKSTGRDDLWTFHDPAARVAGVYGSGGGVDVLSQWTYSYPDPIRIGLATDELFAMARGAASKQDVMKMTQIIWYRSQTAPESKEPETGKPEDAPPRKARWEKEQPEAAFITIAPMHLREAFWTKMARPIKGIMYHGWQSLVPCEPPGGYRFTHPETQHELARLIRQVVQPLGPALIRVPDAKSDVAFLESFAAEMFARRGTYGWGHGWAGDAYHVLLYAKLQPEIVFDETITQRGLDDFRVLVMCDCDVLTQSVAQRVKAFQERGGLVVGDERLAPAITPDILLPVYTRTKRADEDKAALQQLAAGLREQLDARYTRYVDTQSPEVIPRLRRYRDTDYVFVVNDRREFGDYVGRHGLVMENGLPSDTLLTVGRESGFVYDLVEHRQVAVRHEGGKLLWNVQLGPCDGRVLMISPQAIDRVKIAAPSTAPRGETVELAFSVVDAEDRPLAAVVPLEITIRDPQGRVAEFSGYHAAVDGVAKLTLDIAPNDPAGTWQVEARELASGRGAVGYFRVEWLKP